MLKMKYIGTNKEFDVGFERISEHVVQLTGDFPDSDKGFILSREGKNDNWDYAVFDTVYRKLDGSVQFSDDGSVYNESPETGNIPSQEPIPYIPTIEEVRDAKIAEMNIAQQKVIQSGIYVTLSDGDIDHFNLTDHDQTSLMGLQARVLAGDEKIPWHTSDQTEHCKYYSNEDMSIITGAAMQYVTYHVTYFRDLRIYINSLTDKESIEAVTYGIAIPEEYQSEVLKDIYLSQEG